MHAHTHTHTHTHTHVPISRMISLWTQMPSGSCHSNVDVGGRLLWPDALWKWRWETMCDKLPLFPLRFCLITSFLCAFFVFRVHRSWYQRHRVMDAAVSDHRLPWVWVTSWLSPVSCVGHLRNACSCSFSHLWPGSFAHRNLWNQG